MTPASTRRGRRTGWVTKSLATRTAPSANPTARCLAWHTLTGPDAVRRRAAAFAFSSNGLPKKYDYRDWTATTFMFRDRAVGNFAYPWFLCVAVSAVWWALYENVSHLRHPRYDLSEFDRMYALIFTALGFMLVFRLSRAAIRFWDCRTAWGTIAMRGRALCDDAIVNVGAKRPEDVDDLIRWFCAFVVGVKCHLRECGEMPAEQLAGILELGEVERVNASMRSRFHLYCANKMRRAVKRALLESSEEASNENRPDAPAATTGDDVAFSARRRLRHTRGIGGATHGAHPGRARGRRRRDGAHQGDAPADRLRRALAYVSARVHSVDAVVYVSLWGWRRAGDSDHRLRAARHRGRRASARHFSAKRNHLGMDGFCENAIADLSAMLRWWRDG